MAIKMHNSGARKMCAQPWQSEIYAIELKYCPAFCLVQEDLDVSFQILVPRRSVHVKIAAIPIFTELSSKFFETIVFAPVVFDLSVRFIRMRAAPLWVKPASFVERFVISSATGRMPKY